MPSIAQLEERGTVKGKLCDPKVTGSTPVRRIFCCGVAMTHQRLALTRRDFVHLSPYLTPDYPLDG